MKVSARLMCVAAVVAALAVWSLAGSSKAADDKNDLKAEIDKVAGLVAKEDKDGVKKGAEAVAKKAEEIGEVMNLFKLRMRKGFGIGGKADAIKPDGIEAKLTGLAKRAPVGKDLSSQAEALEEMGNRIAAIGHIALAKPPDKDVNLWKGWAEEMSKGGLELASAAKKKNAAGIKTAAAKIELNCTACHDKFKN